jgi:predicted O-linked N-acetylglucosamine transferase (SPINDLY family)
VTPTRQRGNANPYTTLAMPLSPRTQLRAAERWAAQLAPAVPVPRPGRPPRTGQRLRVGFVSSDFREHPVGRLTPELFERLDRDRLESFGYGLLRRDDGPFGRRIAAALDHFVDVSGQPTAAIAQCIRADRIDILFDLNGYTTHERSGVFALRPARVLINWLGYPGTVGAPWFDYMLTDRTTTPPSMQAFFTERFLYLRGNWIPSDARREVAAEAPTRAASGLPREGSSSAASTISTRSFLPSSTSGCACSRRFQAAWSGCRIPRASRS